MIRNGRVSVRVALVLIGCCLLFRCQTTVATVPTIDNIVKILQSPVVQQLILPRPLVGADTGGIVQPTVADEPTTKKPPPGSKPSKAQDSQEPKQSDDASLGTGPTVFIIPQQRALPGCPLCDASVYSYCDEKIYHDGCCCDGANGIGPYGGFGGFGGGSCGYQDCSFLYANSCYEYQLIVNCCCNSPY